MRKKMRRGFQLVGISSVGTPGKKNSQRSRSGAVLSWCLGAFYTLSPNTASRRWPHTPKSNLRRRVGYRERNTWKHADALRVCCINAHQRSPEHIMATAEVKVDVGWRETVRPVWQSPSDAKGGGQGEGRAKLESSTHSSFIDVPTAALSATGSAIASLIEVPTAALSATGSAIASLFGTENEIRL